MTIKTGEIYRSFADKFFRDCSRLRNSIAVSKNSDGPTGTEQLSYLVLAAMVQSLSHQLYQAGVRRGSRVGLGKLPNERFLVAVLALGRLGAASLILYGLRGDSAFLKPDFLVVEADIESIEADIESIGIPIIKFPQRFGGLTEEVARFVPDGFGHGDELACVVGSSGSTGQKKFLTVTAQHLDQAIDDQIELLPRQLGKTLLCVTPTVLYGLMMTLTVLRQGATIVWERSHRDSIERHQVKNIIGAPLSYRMLLDSLSASQTSLAPLDYCVTAGSKISEAFAEEVRTRICPNFFVQYGSTELGPAAFGDTRWLATYPDFAGKLAHWLDAWTVNENNVRLPEGASGRLVFQLFGPRIVAPYVEGQEIKPNEISRPDLYVSEDFGSIRGERVISIESRATERINIGGNKTTIHEIKRELLAMTRISAPLEIVNYKSKEGYDRIAVVIAGEVESLKKHVAQIGKAMRKYHEADILMVNEFPTNAFGKIDYTALRQAAAARRAR